MKYKLVVLAILITFAYMVTSFTIKVETECQKHRNREMKTNLTGLLIPVCNENGDYMSLQCFGETVKKTKFCQCWDKDGNILKGPSTSIKKCECILEKALAEKEKDSSYIPTCESDGSYSKKQCDKTNSCWCANTDGVIIGEKGDSKIICA